MIRFGRRNGICPEFSNFHDAYINHITPNNYNKGDNVWKNKIIT